MAETERIMRKPKQKKTRLIHLIRNTWLKTQKGKIVKKPAQAEIIIAIDCTLFFLEIFDELRKENHKTYFIKLFLSSNNNMTQAQLSDLYKICRDTVSDYCGMYIEVFEKYLSIVKELGIIIEKSDKRSETMASVTKKAVQNRKK